MLAVTAKPFYEKHLTEGMDSGDRGDPSQQSDMVGNIRGLRKQHTTRYSILIIR